MLHSPIGRDTMNLPSRETASPSPGRDRDRERDRDSRPRNIKTHSLPAVLQLFSLGNGSGSNLGSAQSSPTGSTHQGRSPPLPVSQIQRGLPTPPHPGQSSLPNDSNHAHSPDSLSLRLNTNSPPPPGSSSTSAVMQHSNSSPIIPRAVNRHPPPQFLLSKFAAPSLTSSPGTGSISMEDDEDGTWRMADELLAEMKAADGGNQAPIVHPLSGYPLGYASPKDDASPAPSTSPPSNPGASGDRVRMNTATTGKSSPHSHPTSASNQYTHQQQQQHRDSLSGSYRESNQRRASSRDRLQQVLHPPQVMMPLSPKLHHLTGGPHTPERRGSPLSYHTPLGSPSEGPPGTGVGNNGYGLGQSQSSTRRTQGQQQNQTSSPSLQPNPPVPRRTPTHDKSLPVQEDGADEDEEDAMQWHKRHGNSPTPSSDVLPEAVRYGASPPRGNGSAAQGDDGRTSRAGHRSHEPEEEEDGPLINLSDKPNALNLNVGASNGNGSGSGRDGSGGDSGSGGYTPRSPPPSLPDVKDRSDRFDREATIRRNSITTAGSRGHARVGSTDQLGLRGFDALYEQKNLDHVEASAGHQRRNSNDRPKPSHTPEYVDRRNHNQPNTQQQQQRQPYHNGMQKNHVQHHSQHQDYSNGNGNNISVNIPDHELQHFMENPTSAYIQAYLATNSPRPDAPIPPTPHSQTQPPSPSPLLSPSAMAAASMSSNGYYDPTPFSPIMPVGSPYPYPFTHVRRNLNYSNPGYGRPTPFQNNNRPPTAASSVNGSNLGGSNGNSNSNGNMYDPNHPALISEQMSRQYQIYAQNHLGGHVSDSTLDPRATPYPPPGGYFNSWANWHTSKLLGSQQLAFQPQFAGYYPNGAGMAPGRDAMSIRSSPSHEPVTLPKPSAIGLRKRAHRGSRNAASSAAVYEAHAAEKQLRARGRKPPPRVDSTQPRETSPEISSESDSNGESTSTAGEDTSATTQARTEPVNGTLPMAGHEFPLPDSAMWMNGMMPNSLDEFDDSEWIDDDEEDDEDDFLELEYHPTFVSNIDKRKRRWDSKWEAVIQAFQALDKQTDATMILLAAPSHSSKTHILTSRSLRRQKHIINQTPPMHAIRSGFRHIASQRRVMRTQRPPLSSLAERFLLTMSAGTPGTGSPISNDSETGVREEELRRALSAALGSLTALGNIHDQREARWKEEMKRIAEDRERIAILLRQAIGEKDNSLGISSPVPSSDTLLSDKDTTVRK